MANFDPSLLMACTKENPELGAEVIKRIEDEKGYIHLDYKELVRNKKKRKTELGLKLIKSFSDNYMFPYELLRAIMFSHPRQNNKFVISNFPTTEIFMRNFEETCAPFEFLLYFTKLPGNVPENRSQNFNAEVKEILSEYHTKRKLVEIGTNS
jgi:adenylate kinase family enzyme